MITNQAIQIEAERQRDLRMRADHERLIRLAGGHGAMSYRVWLAALGRLMVDWGYRLQARHGRLAMRADRAAGHLVAETVPRPSAS